MVRSSYHQHLMYFSIVYDASHLRSFDNSSVHFWSGAFSQLSPLALRLQTSFLTGTSTTSSLVDCLLQTHPWQRSLPAYPTSSSSRARPLWLSCQPGKSTLNLGQSLLILTSSFYVFFHFLRHFLHNARRSLTLCTHTIIRSQTLVTLCRSPGQLLKVG